MSLGTGRQWRRRSLPAHYDPPWWGEKVGVASRRSVGAGPQRRRRRDVHASEDEARGADVIGGATAAPPRGALHRRTPERGVAPRRW